MGLSPPALTMVTRGVFRGQMHVSVWVFHGGIARAFRHRVDILGGAPLTLRASPPLAHISPDAHADHAATPAAPPVMGTLRPPARHVGSRARGEGSRWNLRLRGADG
jgi:hypothetical protein